MFNDDPALLELNQKFAHVHIEPNQETINVTDDTVKTMSLLNALDHPPQGKVHVVKAISEMRNNENILPLLCAIRRYLSEEISVQRIENVLCGNILDILNGFLKDSEQNDIQYEAAWVVTNLASGTKTQTLRLIESQTAEALVQGFYYSKNTKIQTQMVWAIANISMDSSFYRKQLADIFFIKDVAEMLIVKLNEIDPQVKLLKGLTWSLATLCRGGFNTSDYWKQYMYAFNAFSRAVFLDNPDIWMEACWGLARVISNNYKNQDFFFELPPHYPLCRRLVSMLRTKSEKEVSPILHAISNFSTGPLTHTLLEADLLNSLWWFCSPDIQYHLRRNALFTVSNLACGDPQVVAQLVDNENVMRTLLYHLSIPGHEYTGEWVLGEDLRSGSFLEECKVLREVLFVFINIMTFALDDCIRVLLDNYKEITPSLVHILHFNMIFTGITNVVIDLLLLIIRRTMKSESHYIYEMIGEGIMVALSHHRDPELIDKIHLLRYTIENNGVNLVSEETVTPNPRRMVQGKEDGDIRFIEDAMDSMAL